MDEATLHTEIAKVCPAISATIVDEMDRNTWSFVPGAAATPAQIAAGNTVQGYDPNRLGGPAFTYTAPATRGSSFATDGTSTVTWPGDPTPPVPRGRFLHGDRHINPATGRPYGGVFAGYLIAPSAVKAADGKPW